MQIAGAEEDIDEILGKINVIENKSHNDISLLDNRFRIDPDIQEVTLVFFRKKGTRPIVLVRPDGSKLYLENDSTDDSYRWHETASYDMISLVNPMPGPWQAIGEILPGSRIVVIANISLQTDPIPSPIFQGENLKMTARLVNAGEEVDFTDFREVVSLSLEFSSTNNPNHDNFGLGTRTVARFEDNGLGFDEEARDGVFTGQFSMDITAGEWLPVASVRTPLLSRQKQLPRVVLHRTPIFVSHTEQEGEEGYHEIVIDADEQWINLETMLIDGNVRQPNGETQRIFFTEIMDGPKTIETDNVGYGVYSVSLTIFAQSVTGRDLVINLPRYSFTTLAPPPIIEEVAIDAVETEEETIIEPEKPNYLFLAIVINLSLLFVGGLLIFTLVDKRKHASNLWYKRSFKKLLSLIPKKDKTDSEAATEQ